MTEEAATSIRVLIVDDEPTQMEMTKINIENADPSYQITLALNLKDALKLLQEKSFDVIVSDYQMPEMNGIQLCTTIRKTINIPFIIYTARGSEEVASAAFAAGVDDYVRKEATLAHIQVLEKRIRQAVEKRRIETLYRLSIDDNCDGLAIIQGLDFVFANKAMANMLGLNSPEDLKGRSILTWIPIMEQYLIRDRKLNRQRGGAEPALYEYRVKKDNGDIRILEARVTLIDYLGHPASLIFNHDVTERKRTEDALRESEQKYRGLFENIQELVTLYQVVRDEKGEIIDRRLLDCNPAFLKTANVKSVEEIRGKSWGQIFEKDDAQGNLPSIKSAMSSGKPVTFESRRKDIDKVYLTTITPLGKDSYLATGRDITDLKRTDKELRETSEKDLRSSRNQMQEYANRLEVIVENGETRLQESEELLLRLQHMDTISRIGATVAHDLRGPLVAISQAAEMARQKQELSDKMLGLIANNAERSLKMIEAFREGTREVRVVKKETNLSVLVKETVESMFKPENVSIDTQLGEGLDNVSLDPDLMHRVFDNLLRNSVEAMPNGGKITISTRRDGDDALIKVSDTGIGVREEDSKHFFEPLFTTKVGGYGLGLYYVRMAVDAHGGKVSFSSKPEKGTTFNIILPIR